MYKGAYKNIYSALLILFLTVPSFGQSKKEFKEQTLSEIISIIENALELLGKTDSAIMAAGRPMPIIGGDIWEVKSFETPGKNSMNASNAIIIGTGRGALMVIISINTGLAYNITYMPHKNAHINGVTLLKYLGEKYSFNNDGFCITNNATNGKIGIMVLKGALNISAVGDDGKALKFLKK